MSDYAKFLTGKATVSTPAKPAHRLPRKLTHQKAAEIRRQYFARQSKQRELALEFGVAQSIISRVVSGQIWGKPMTEPTEDEILRTIFTAIVVAQSLPTLLQVNDRVVIDTLPVFAVNLADAVVKELNRRKESK